MNKRFIGVWGRGGRVHCPKCGAELYRTGNWDFYHVVLRCERCDAEVYDEHRLKAIQSGEE